MILMKKTQIMESISETKPKVFNFNKPAYLLFAITGVGFLIANDFSQAVVFFGLALVFDPFDITVPFKKRPLYQQVWLIVHLAITIALFVLMLMGK